MNRAILMVAAPAALIGMIYWGLGMRPAPRAVGGMIVFLSCAFYFALRKKPKGR